MRLHPAESRIRKLAKETPAVLILFDLFVTPAAETLLDAPLVERRPHLERFHASIRGAQGLRLSPYTWSVAEARGWLEASGGAVDGVIAKRLDLIYEPGERAMLKVKRRRTADCVVGAGFAMNGTGRLSARVTRPL